MLPLFACVLGITCGGEAVLVYSRTGGNLLLPCADLLLSDCSPISWTFFTSGGSWNSVEIGKSQVGAESHESNRISITSNCSLRLQGLKEENAGSYNCHRNGSTVVAYYLSVLTISSASSVTSLQPGGNLSLSCLLFTYFDAGNCRASSMFNLSWVSEDGATLATDNRSASFRPLHMHTHQHYEFRYISNYIYQNYKKKKKTGFLVFTQKKSKIFNEVKGKKSNTWIKIFNKYSNWMFASIFSAQSSW